MARIPRNVPPATHCIGLSIASAGMRTQRRIAWLSEAFEPVPTLRSRPDRTYSPRNVPPRAHCSGKSSTVGAASPEISTWPLACRRISDPVDFADVARATDQIVEHVAVATDD